MPESKLHMYICSTQILAFTCWVIGNWKPNQGELVICKKNINNKMLAVMYWTVHYCPILQSDIKLIHLLFEMCQFGSWVNFFVVKYFVNIQDFQQILCSRRVLCPVVRERSSHSELKAVLDIAAILNKSILRDQRKGRQRKRAVLLPSPFSRSLPLCHRFSSFPGVPSAPRPLGLWGWQKSGFPGGHRFPVGVGGWGGKGGKMSPGHWITKKSFGRKHYSLVLYILTNR